jgi:hypothetical protein
MPEHIDDSPRCGSPATPEERLCQRMESAIDYYLRISKNHHFIQNQLQQLAITQFSLSDLQIAEFRLKIYQLNMQAKYADY